MAIPVLGNIWQLARRVEDLFTDVAKLELLVEKTRTAASVAASSAVTTHLVDMSRRIGALEARQNGQRRIE